MPRYCAPSPFQSLLSRSTSFTLLPLLLLVFFLLTIPQNALAVNVTLTWDANEEEDLAGYRIYHREEGQSYNYDTPSWEGTETSCTLFDLADDTNHYFVARAFDIAGNESVDSDQEFFMPNRPPVLDAIGSKSGQEGQILEFTVTASDPDNDQLTFAAGNLPTGAAFDGATQTFTWAPDYGASGNYAVTFTVTDNGSPVQSDSEEVTITVAADRQPPSAPTGP
jgi:fibronectin type 3 domain-containing protein